MAAKLGVETENLRTFASECEQQHGVLEANIGRFKKTEDDITATWTGSARDAFNAFMERYYAQAEKVNDKLLETVESLMKTSGHFSEQDQVFSKSLTDLQADQAADVPIKLNLPGV
ncbi:WXG100 family type VII secretion target [Nocardia sp. 2]|uniref:WXG100 family type VII secretion target n=1 Tax=Nocardia acididurans TaxID=2802282 RepID=A0ABS1M4J9_9NOCA|nr:WXG100 family type VII secretion target [Nocardia acididurans]MBL1075124.1 WXG100 family type VII secretion target [Nocardia acididurans]